MFGKRLSDILNVEYKPDILIRTSKTKTQTLKQRFERFSNNKTKFKLVDTTLLKINIFYLLMMLLQQNNIRSLCKRTFKNAKHKDKCCYNGVYTKD